MTTCRTKESHLGNHTACNTNLGLDMATRWAPALGTQQSLSSGKFHFDKTAKNVSDPHIQFLPTKIALTGKKYFVCGILLVKEISIFVDFSFSQSAGTFFSCTLSRDLYPARLSTQDRGTFLSEHGKCKKYFEKNGHPCTSIHLSHSDATVCLRWKGTLISQRDVVFKDSLRSKQLCLELCREKQLPSSPCSW